MEEVTAEVKLIAKIWSQLVMCLDRSGPARQKVGPDRTGPDQKTICTHKFIFEKFPKLKKYVFFI